MIIIIDNREQRPVLFDKVGSPDFPGLKIKNGTLKTGDYSIKGMSTPECPHSVCIERKSLQDLFGTASGGRRDRFEAELARMEEFDHAEIVIEQDLRAVFESPPPVSLMNPKAVYASLVAWSQRSHIKIWPCPNRMFAEQHIYMTLRRFWDDRQINGKMEFVKI
ncbi:MAG: hypothetical protein GY710_26270 [Desulfobacteraceae bacterium]|nr:hypothetical protein [Desulfobacteraceae bacterium]